MILSKPRIIDVTRKPSKCPVCGERVVDIIYGTGDMTEVEFLFKYRREGMMGGDNIPRRPPIWECTCGCKRFRKVNPDGTDAPVKVKMLKDIRKGSLENFIFETPSVQKCIIENCLDELHDYLLEIETELGETERFHVSATTENKAFEEARQIVFRNHIGLLGKECVSIKVISDTINHPKNK